MFGNKNCGSVVDKNITKMVLLPARMKFSFHSAHKVFFSVLLKIVLTLCKWETPCIIQLLFTLAAARFFVKWIRVLLAEFVIKLAPFFGKSFSKVLSIFKLRKILLQCSWVFPLHNVMASGKVQAAFENLQSRYAGQGKAVGWDYLTNCW